MFPQASDNVNLVAVIAIASERIGKRYRTYGLFRQEEGLTDIAQNAFVQAAEFSQKSLKYMNLRQTLDPNDSQNKRRVFVANTNLCTSFIYLKKLDEADKYWKVSENLLAELYKKDPENKETVLDELSILKNKVELLMTGNQWNDAFQFTQKAIELAEKNEKASSGNAFALTWVGYFYERQMEILKAQGKNTQYQERIIQDLKTKYLEKFNASINFKGYGL